MTNELAMELLFIKTAINTQDILWMACIMAKANTFIMTVKKGSTSEITKMVRSAALGLLNGMAETNTKENFLMIKEMDLELTHSEKVTAKVISIKGCKKTKCFTGMGYTIIKMAKDMRENTMKIKDKVMVHIS
jgi:hypothetical protein